MISNSKPATTRFMVLGAVFLLFVAPSRSFVVPVYTKRLSSPLLASTTGGKVDATGDRDNPDVNLGVSFMRPPLGEEASDGDRRVATDGITRDSSSDSDDKESGESGRGVGGGGDDADDDDRAQTPNVANPVVGSTSDAVSSAKPEGAAQLVYGETTARSFVKALLWRVTAAVVTLVSGLVFSGSLATAMSIVGSDFLTKSGFMFLGERLWNKVKWGQGKSGDSAQRSLAKALLWRVFAASNTLVCGIFLARDLSVASKIAGTDTVFKTGLFFINERVWSTIKWGKKYEPEYFI